MLSKKFIDAAYSARGNELCKFVRAGNGSFRREGLDRQCNGRRIQYSSKQNNGKSKADDRNSNRYYYAGTQVISTPAICLLSISACSRVCLL